MVRLTPRERRRRRYVLVALAFVAIMTLTALIAALHGRS